MTKPNEAPEQIASNRKLAERIADDLFISGQGVEAYRLVLSNHGEDDGRTGWAKKPVADRIEDILNAGLAPTEPCGEDSGSAYNGGVIAAIHKELIGPVEYERLAKTPWARSLVHGLVQRIANLRNLLVRASVADWQPSGNSPNCPACGRVKECDGKQSA